MALDEYRRKRDFTTSPEPAGAANRRSPEGREARFFCVQKHLASHLHYDFRLEHNGVLLSWAVPKGPSIDPSVKRLAMHVEDHPLEYGEFEGVIPSGYGAGIVMLWDVGTWTPEVEDVEAALKKGDLKFTLEGYKLKGSWVLVRTKGARWSSGGADRSWLLIKHRDQWSGAIDIAEFAPRSVKSEGDFAEILAEGNPDIWRSNRPAQGGDTGALFERIVARALEMRAGDVATPARKRVARKRSPAARKTSGTARTPATSTRKAPAQRRTTPARKSTASQAGKRRDRGTKRAR
jgi:bifunctional non-homologous end joining protein LigD